METCLTPIEDRAAWQVHRRAFDAARARGADFHAAHKAGFEATAALAGEDERKLLHFANNSRTR